MPSGVHGKWPQGHAGSNPATLDTSCHRLSFGQDGAAANAAGTTRLRVRVPPARCRAVAQSGRAGFPPLFVAAAPMEGVMEEKGYLSFETKDGSPIKAWVRGVPFDDSARRQLENTARLPFIYKWVAAMPDVHTGIGATVGSVVATKGAIVPASVGVDIGCGMLAVRTTLTAAQLPESLGKLRRAIEARIPVGKDAHRESTMRRAAVK